MPPIEILKKNCSALLINQNAVVQNCYLFCFSQTISTFVFIKKPFVGSWVCDGSPRLLAQPFPLFFKFPVDFGTFIFLFG